MDPARNTYGLKKSPASLPHSFLNFETPLIQYYNLKTSVICFVLKRKIENKFCSFCYSSRKRGFLQA